MAVDVQQIVASMLADGATPEQIVAALVAQGATEQQITVGREQAVFDLTWGALMNAITAQLPTITAEQIAAFESFVLQGFGFDDKNLGRAGLKLWEITRNRDTQTFVAAVCILASTLYKLRPDLRPVEAV